MLPLVFENHVNINLLKFPSFEKFPTTDYEALLHGIDNWEKSHQFWNLLCYVTMAKVLLS